MTEDPVVEEVRRIRQEHAARFEYDLEAIFNDLKATEAARNRQQSPLLDPPEPLDTVPGQALHRTASALRRVGLWQWRDRKGS